MSLRQRVSAAVLGVKGSFLRQDQNAQNKNENPVARLRLLLVRYIFQTTSGILITRGPDCFLPYPPHAQPLHNPHACYCSSTLSQPPFFEVSAPVQRACSGAHQEGGYHVPHHLQRPLQPGHSRAAISTL